MNNIIIVGAGPRGLAVALQLSQLSNKSQTRSKYNVKLIDPTPINSWSYPNIINDIVMRSPITFDLTTYIESLQKFSLTKYLGYDLPFSFDQQTIEECNIKLNRKQFKSYLDKTLRYLDVTGTHIIKKEVLSITDNEVTIENDKFTSDHIVIATGVKGNYKIPNWVKQTDLRNKLTSIQTIIKEQTKGNVVCVIGSGQGAAEFVHYLATNNNYVYWCTNKEIKVENYPSPSFKEWGMKSALGPHYKHLPKEKKLDYLGKVKAWQPSMTPHISKVLEEVKDRVKIINPTETTEVQDVFDKCNQVVLATGEELDIDNLPFDIKIERDILNNSYPALIKGFKSVSNPSLSFTGSLALMYDGPRQNSLISAAITAKEIIENL